ncbi:MAG: hypothetical protein MJ003_06175 [Paludibacteraceae bacterium]|nr:hypothetical protein [Paludibacteraceae bacterium]
MRKTLLTSLIFLTFCINITAEDDGIIQKYRRNSLVTIMVHHPEDEFGKDIKSAYLEIPTPDKYDNHDVGLKVLEYHWLEPLGLSKAVYGNNLSSREIDRNGTLFENFLNNANFGNYLVAKWYNLSSSNPDSATFNMELIKERGMYDATSFDVETAMRTTRGLATLSDAGEELIEHTFVLINDMTYVTAEQKAEAAKKALSIIGGMADMLFGGSAGRNLASTAAAIADSFTGFKVRNHSYLFQLQWNDSIQAVFYKDYYTETPNPEKIKAFLDNNELFKIKYVAHEYEYDENSVLKGEYDRHELIKINCTRSQDKNIASLQKAYEEFKLKTPIYQVITDEKGKTLGYAVKVGLKEGITEKSKFQVVQHIVDPKTNKSRYKYVATLAPVKGKIWDNRYMAAEEKEKGSELTYTLLKKKSGGEIYPGMLVIEGKYTKVEQ